MFCKFINSFIAFIKKTSKQLANGDIKKVKSAKKIIMKPTIL